jgi:translocation and assembly module TamA
MTGLPLYASAQEPTFAYAIELQAPLEQRAMLESNLDIYRWRARARMDEGQLRRLVRSTPAQIRRFLETQGFYSPSVEISLEGEAGRWVVKLRVDPAEPVRVGSYDLQVRGLFTDGSAHSQARLQKMRDAWPMREGVIFQHAQWEASKRDALKALLTDRYPSATIANETMATVNPTARLANLTVTLDSGPAYSFGKVEISGLQRYPHSVVDYLNDIRPGDPYLQSRLLDLQSRLQDSPYFAGADVFVDTDPMQDSLEPVSVQVPVHV